MDVRCEETDESVICHLAGNLDQLTVGGFRAAIARVISKQRIIFDLSGVPFLDSAGMGALIGAVRRIRETGGEAVICAPRPSVKRVLDVVGLPRIVGVVNNVADAMEILSAVV